MHLFVIWLLKLCWANPLLPPTLGISLKEGGITTVYRYVYYPSRIIDNMDKKGNLKRNLGIALHQWLVKLHLLKDPWRNQQSNDITRENRSNNITMKNIAHMTVEQPGDMTIEEPVDIIRDSPEQMTVKEPNQVTIQGDPLFVIDNPTSVTVQGCESVISLDANGQRRLVTDSKTADESGRIILPDLDTVRTAGVEKLVIK